MSGGIEERSAAAARFRFEAQIAARLSRKTRHIVRVTDHGDEDGLAYLVMELLDGRTLENCLMMYGAMTPEAVSRLVTQIARALEHAHAESVVHRDLKPANLFVARDEDGGMLVKVLDFGIARAIRTQRISAPFSTGDGLVFGTPGYMSPEQACAAKLDARADLWALATVAYEALTGDLPLPGVFADELLRSLYAGRIVPVHERKPELPPGFAEFFRQAFAPRIEHRFSSAAQLARAFERSTRMTHPREPASPAFGGSARRGETQPMPEAMRADAKGSAPRSRAAWPRRAAIALALSVLALAAAIPLRQTRARGVLPVAAAAPTPMTGPGAPADADGAQPAPTPESSNPLDVPASRSTTSIRAGEIRGRTDRPPGAATSAIPRSAPSVAPTAPTPAPVPPQPSDPSAVF